MERAESLRKQMEILLDLKSAMKQQKDRGSLNSDSKEDQSISSSISFGQFDSSLFLLKLFFNSWANAKEKLHDHRMRKAWDSRKWHALKCATKLIL